MTSPALKIPDTEASSEPFAFVRETEGARLMAPGETTVDLGKRD